ncbi:hypothetical protein V6N13_014809 [Hibiscus sabdariffa]
MGVGKKVMVLWMCAMVVMEHGADAQPWIKYPAMGANLQMPCKRNFRGCLSPPANEYNRGCEASQRCRGGGGRKFMPIISP